MAKNKENHLHTRRPEFDPFFQKKESAKKLTFECEKNEVNEQSFRRTMSADVCSDPNFYNCHCLCLRWSLGQIDVKEEVSNIHLIWMGKFANGETLSLE